jgi:hypothetical protein
VAADDHHLRVRRQTAEFDQQPQASASAQ